VTHATFSIGLSAHDGECIPSLAEPLEANGSPAGRCVMTNACGPRLVSPRSFAAEAIDQHADLIVSCKRIDDLAIVGSGQLLRQGVDPLKSQRRVTADCLPKSDLLKSAGRVLVQQTRDQRLIRQSFCERPLLNRLQVLARQTNIQSTILAKRDLGIASIARSLALARTIRKFSPLFGPKKRLGLSGKLGSWWISSRCSSCWRRGLAAESAGFVKIGGSGVGVPGPRDEYS